MTSGKGLATGAALAVGIFGLALFGLQWLMSIDLDLRKAALPLAEPPIVALVPAKEVAKEVAEVEVASPPVVPVGVVLPDIAQASEPLFEGFKLLGESEASNTRELCSDDARSEMTAFAVSIAGGDVVVRESEWKGRATSSRANLASWYSQCTREGREVRIVGDASGDVLALYHPRIGYREPPRNASTWGGDQG